jgi:hypothetical protein
MYGIIPLLGILFVGLKLAGIIDWSWWLVTLPLYGGIVVYLAIVAVCLVLAMSGKGKRK